MDKEREQQLIRKLRRKSRPTFLSVLRSNIKCAFCKEKDCSVRYYPKRRQEEFHHGSIFVTSCKKDKDKWLNRL